MSKQFDFYNVRDEIIPNGKNAQLEKFLNENNRLTQCNIESLIGASIAESNHIATSLLNLYREENNIPIDKSGILKSIYWAECRRITAANKDVCISWRSFDEDIENEYMWVFRDIFK